MQSKTVSEHSLRTFEKQLNNALNEIKEENIDNQRKI